MPEKIDVCPHCHRDYRETDKWPKIYKCGSCGEVFCEKCTRGYNNAECPSCRSTKCRKVQFPERKTSAEKKVIAEAKRRAEEEAKRRAETLREFENKTYSLGTRIGNRYYSDYED